jgi:4-amino-4-deoxy-L-arabinose transferase-like glycosyltransferase
MTFTTEQKWLRFAAAFVIVTGAFAAMAALPALNAPFRMFADLAIWPYDGRETLASTEARVLSAVSGGVLVGWGVALWHLAGEGIERAPDLSRRIILWSVLVWFAVDSTGSLAAGVPLNIASNLVFLALFLIPLVRMARRRPVSA